MSETNESESVEATETTTADGNTKPKRKPKRKPIYVCVPVTLTPVTLFDEEGFETLAYTVPEGVVPGTAGGSVRGALYTVTRCEGGQGQADAVRAALKANEIDPTNFEGVIMLRAHPIQPKIKISQQVIVRF